MKKTRFLVLTLVVSIMMMGAGYAYWSDTLTINNTVSTGEMNVEFINSSVEADEYITNGVDPTLEDSTGNIKTISFTASNLYPGAEIAINTEFKNTGTIPAVLQDLGFVYETDSALAAAGYAQVPEAELVHFLVSGTVSYDGVSATIPAGTTLANVKDTVNSVLPELLQAGNSGALELIITLDPDLEGDELENSYLKGVITLDFLQHNDPSNGL